MRNRGVSCAVLVVCLLVACSDSDSPGGAGGSGGAAVAGSGGSAAGGRGGGGSQAGAGGGNCTDCIACVQASCASQLAQCQNNAGCNAIFQCAMACTMHLEQCLAANASGVSTWGPSVAACANVSCVSNGCPY